MRFGFHPLLSWGGAQLDTPPDAASSVSATPIGHSVIRVDWADNSDNESGFRLDYAPTASGVSVLGPVWGVNAVTGTIGGLSSETEYRVWAVAFNGGGATISTNSSVGVTGVAPDVIVGWAHTETTQRVRAYVATVLSDPIVEPGQTER